MNKWFAAPDSDGGRGAASAGDGSVGQAPLAERSGFVTAESVYGIILVSGMIVASGGKGATSWTVFLSVLGTVIVFWAAHVYAGTVAAHGVKVHDGHTSLKTAFRLSLRRSLGLLTAALLPSAILLLGALQAIDDTVAIWTALWLGVVLLAVIGYSAFARLGSTFPMRIVGALTTAAFGVAMIVLKAVIH
jgi:hypothetical protein